MTKALTKNKSKLRKKEKVTDELDMLEDSAYCTLCMIHNSVKSNDNFPIHHQMLQICPGSSHNNCHKNSRSGNRSGSPRGSRGKTEQKSTSSLRQNWATTLKNSSAFHNEQSTGDKPTSQAQLVLRSNVGKASSCPDRTCSCISKASSKSTSKPLKRCSFKSQNTVQVCSSLPVNPQIAEHISCTDAIVSKLKDEIEEVKNKLHQFSDHNTQALKDEEEANKKITQLRTENKRLKKELDQNKKLQEESVNEVQKAKDIMSDYEQKVEILHQQALKSSKVMKQSKERFCKCIKQKETLIEDLQKSNNDLHVCITEKERKYEELSKIYADMEKKCLENDTKCGILSDSNEKFCECIELLHKELQNSIRESEEYKDEIKKLEKQLTGLKCTMCQKLEVKAKKQKEKYESRLKEYEENESMLKKQISELSIKIKEMEPGKLDELQNKLIEYENCISKCKFLEKECKQKCEAILRNEKQFEKERCDMRQLVDELTTVVKQNKVTLLELSNINKQQETLLGTQSVILSEKDEKIRWAESTIEMMQTKSIELEREVEDLRKSLSGPCTSDTCSSLSKELEDTRTALTVEKENQLVKDKIIDDQSQTICSLQYQIKEKMSELDKAREDTSIAEDEIIKINNELLKTRNELEMELNEKEHLLKKLKKLEYQKSLLTKEMRDLETLLQQYYDAQEGDKKYQSAIGDLQKQIEKQRHEWESQKENLYAEKEKAVSAAKFATQKLLDTVADFQKQVNTQKKVQNMLTRMLHDKEEELKTIKSKMISINSITSGAESEIPMNEIYKRKNGFDVSNGGTSSSFYSFCSNCSSTMRAGQNYEKVDLQQLFNLITRTEEEPIKDS